METVVTEQGLNSKRRHSWGGVGAGGDDTGGAIAGNLATDWVEAAAGGGQQLEPQQEGRQQVVWQRPWPQPWSEQQEPRS